MNHSLVLIDDDELILNTLRKQFDGWNMQVYPAHTPAEAKDILAKLTPDIILLDLVLTQGDGAEGILDYIKSQDRLANVPVLVLTNLDKPEMKEMVLSQGVKEYLIKGSLSLEDLHDKVVSYLEPGAGNT